MTVSGKVRKIELRSGFAHRDAEPPGGTPGA